MMMPADDDEKERDDSLNGIKKSHLWSEMCAAVIFIKKKEAAKHGLMKR